MIDKKWMKFGAAAFVVALLAVAGVAAAHANGALGGKGAGARGVTYDGDPSSGSITNVTKNGTLLFEAITWSPEDAQVGLRGGAHVRALNATTVTLTLPADATVATHEAVENWSPAGATITYASGETINIRVKNGSVAQDGGVITVSLDEGGAAMIGPTGDGACEGKGHGPRGAHGVGRAFAHAFGQGGRGGHGHR